MLNNLVRFIFPEMCHLCRSETKLGIYPLCKSCRKAIVKDRYKRTNDEHDYFLGSAVSFTKYSQDLVHKLKYGRKEVFSIIMGKIIYKEVLSTIDQQIDFVLPVPISKKRKMSRGFNQTDKLATEIAKLLKCNSNLTNLARVVHTKTQTKLNKRERRENMEGVFTILNPMIFKNKNILLVDDVITTGATVDSCRDVLLNAGAKNVYTSSFARA